MNIFSALHESASARLRAGTYFDGTGTANGKAVTVLTEKIGDLAQQIEKAITKLGVCAVVATPKVEPGDGPGVKQVTIVCQIAECVLFNQGATGTKAAASDLGAVVLVMWENWSPSGEWTAFEFHSLAPVSFEDKDGNLVYEASFTTTTILTP